MRVFLDANIVFSASNPSSPLHRLIDDIENRGRLVSSSYTVDEARRNVEAKRSQWIARLEILVSRLVLVEAFPAVDFSFSLPEKDQPILGAAICAGCTHLLTGDKRHFGHLFRTTVEGVRIVTPLLLAKELASLQGIRKE